MERSAFPYFARVSTRWADCDPYGHVNNVQYYSYFDTALTTLLIERGVLRSQEWDSIGLCVESHCNFHRSIDFPAELEVGVRIGRLGEKSIRFEFGIFTDGEDQAAATGHFVHVYVDPATRRPAPLAEGQRAALADCVVEAASPAGA